MDTWAHPQAQPRSTGPEQDNYGNWRKPQFVSASKTQSQEKCKAEGAPIPSPTSIASTGSMGPPQDDYGNWHKSQFVSASKTQSQEKCKAGGAPIPSPTSIASTGTLFSFVTDQTTSAMAVDPRRRIGFAAPPQTGSTTDEGESDGWESDTQWA